MKKWKHLFLIFLILILPVIGFSADVKITDLPDLTTPTPDDLLLSVDDPLGSAATKKLKIANLSKALGWVDVRAYGAKGDGITDDTVAIQAALNAGGAAKIPIYAPSGTYLISDVLKMTYDNQILLGDGGWVNMTYPGKTIFQLKDNVDPTYLLVVGNSADTNNTNGAVIKNIAFSGGTIVTHATGSGVHFRSNFGHMENVTISSFKDNGLVVEGGPTDVNFNYVLRFTDILLDHCGNDNMVIKPNISDSFFIRVYSSNAGRYGIYDQGKGGEFVTCHAYLCGSHGMMQTWGGKMIGGQYEGNVGAGIYLSTTGATLINGVSVYGNQYAIGQVVIDGCEAGKIINSHFQISAGANAIAILLKDTASHNIISLNTIKGQTGTGIKITDTAYLNTISMNDIYELTTPIQAILVDSSGYAGNFIYYNHVDHNITESGSANRNRFIGNRIRSPGVLTVIGSFSENIGNYSGGDSDTSKFIVKPGWSGITNLGGLATYANNAAALSAGLVAGDLYVTATGQVMRVY